MDGAAMWRTLAGLQGKPTSWVRAMYWMRSTWCTSLSSWSMLSLAARCRWKWRLFGEPGKSGELHQPLLTQSGKGCHVNHATNRRPMFVWALTLFRLSSSLFRTGYRQELKLTWTEQTLRHRAICLVLVSRRVYPTHSW